MNYYVIQWGGVKAYLCAEDEFHALQRAQGATDAFDRFAHGILLGINVRSKVKKIQQYRRGTGTVIVPPSQFPVRLSAHVGMTLAPGAVPHEGAASSFKELQCQSKANNP